MNNEYNKEPVECCNRCKNLYLIEEDEKVYCTKCGDINNIEIVNNIEDYIDKYGLIWNTK